METLVASVLIVVIFMIAGMTLNTIFYSTTKNDMKSIKAYLYELQYLQKNKKLELPFQDTFGEWEIYVNSFEDGGINIIEFEAINSATNKTIFLSSNESK